MSGENKVGGKAPQMSRICRQLSGLLVRHRASAVFINQLRDKPGVKYGRKTTTPGGKAVHYHSSIRLEIVGGTAVKDSKDVHTGKEVIVISEKNRLSPPRRQAKVKLDFETGWDDVWSTIRHAKELELIPKLARVSEKTHAKALEVLGWNDTGMK